MNTQCTSRIQRGLALCWLALPLGMGACSSDPVASSGPGAGSGVPGPGAAGTGTAGPGGAGTGVAGIGVAGIGVAGTGGLPVAGAGPGAGGMGPAGPLGPPPQVTACAAKTKACTNGKAGKYACKAVDLLAYVDAKDMQGPQVNDIWGWEDPMTGTEYALVCLDNGMAFVDISNPCEPLFLGQLRGHGGMVSKWRDVKVFKDHAFIVADSAGNHGLQVFDLTQLRNVTAPPMSFQESAHLASFPDAHNIGLNEESGFAYAVSAGGCAVRMIDVNDPLNPKDVGCYGTTGRGTHDIQCVNYKGPDAAYAGKEICLSSARSGLQIDDVSDKTNVVKIGEVSYPNASIVHQGWLTEDHQYFLLGDEGDESTHQVKTTTYILDVRQLAMPKVIGKYVARTPAIDHNLYIKGTYAYQANYAAGLRILDISNIAMGKLKEVAFFDSFPPNNAASFDGVWSVYPFFRSGIVVLSGNHLWVLYPTGLTQAPPF